MKNIRHAATLAKLMKKAKKKSKKKKSHKSKKRSRSSSQSSSSSSSSPKNKSKKPKHQKKSSRSTSPQPSKAAPLSEDKKEENKDAAKKRKYLSDESDSGDEKSGRRRKTSEERRAKSSIIMPAKMYKYGLIFPKGVSQPPSNNATVSTAGSSSPPHEVVQIKSEFNIKTEDNIKTEEPEPSAMQGPMPLFRRDANAVKRLSAEEKQQKLNEMMADAEVHEKVAFERAIHARRTDAHEERQYFARDTSPSRKAGFISDLNKAVYFSSNTDSLEDRIQKFKHHRQKGNVEHHEFL